MENTQKKQYYDNARLLSMKDINGKEAGIYQVCGTRGAGKTFSFSRLCVSRFLKGKGEFILYYRRMETASKAADAFPRDIFARVPAFSGCSLLSEKVENGIYRLLFTGKGKEKAPCGFAVSLSAQAKIKTYRPLFNEVGCEFFDEFQAPRGEYLKDEVFKLLDIHTTIRGDRHIPLYMSSNSFSIINPYFIAEGISHRIQKDTHFLRSDGLVTEFTDFAPAVERIESDPVTRALAGIGYADFAANNVYLDDNKNFVAKPRGVFLTYRFTLCYKEKSFGVFSYEENGDPFLYVSTSADETCKMRFSVLIKDHKPDTLRPDFFYPVFDKCKRLFDFGAVRFQDILCKEAFFMFIGISAF